MEASRAKSGAGAGLSASKKVSEPPPAPLPFRRGGNRFGRRRRSIPRGPNFRGARAENRAELFRGPLPSASLAGGRAGFSRYPDAAPLAAILTRRAFPRASAALTEIEIVLFPRPADVFVFEEADRAPVCFAGGAGLMGLQLGGGEDCCELGVWKS